jgi:Subtilase family
MRSLISARICNPRIRSSYCRFKDNPCNPSDPWFYVFVTLMKSKPWLWLTGFFACAVLGYWLARSASRVDESTSTAKPSSEAPAPKRMVLHEEPVRFKTDRERGGSSIDTAALKNGALQGQRSLVFKDRESMNRFLAKNGNIRVLDRIDALNALRIGFDDPDDLAKLLDGDEEESFIYPVSAPPPPQGTVQPGAVALGGALHEWLGITGDNSTWGKGITIAVLDTAIDPHRSLSTSIRSIDLVNPTAPTGDSRGHGTAVASMIAGSNSVTPGVAPAADLLSIRVADDRGMSDSFQLAKGIHAALENGADLINISMGSQGDSALVRRAVEDAQSQGVLIVAAAGNNGIEQVSYPAANEGVISVGAVDAMGSHLAFSNTGEQIDISAPGLDVNAAWSNDVAVRVTGTSFSAPIVTGAIAAVMTEAGTHTLTASQAWERIRSVLNDGGAPGTDNAIGAGMPDIGRVLQSGTPGIYDAAVTNQRILTPSATSPYGELETTLQNRGTETLINTSVTVSLDNRESKINLTTLAPNEVRVVRVPLTRALSGESGGITATSTTSLSASKDAKPSNDRRQTTFSAE